MAESEKKSEQQLTAKPVKAKPVKEKKKKVVSDGVFLPVLVEFTYTFSVIILILLFLSVVSVSILTGTKLLDIVVRTSVSMMVVGSLLLMLSRQVSMDVISASILEKKEKEEKLEKEKLEKELQSEQEKSEDREISGSEKFTEFENMESQSPSSEVQ